MGRSDGVGFDERDELRIGAQDVAHYEAFGFGHVERAGKLPDALSGSVEYIRRHRRGHPGLRVPTDAHSQRPGTGADIGWCRRAKGCPGRLSRAALASLRGLCGTREQNIPEHRRVREREVHASEADELEGDEAAGHGPHDRDECTQVSEPRPETTRGE